MQVGDTVYILNSKKYHKCFGKVVSFRGDWVTVNVSREFEHNGENWKEHCYVSFLKQNLIPHKLAKESTEDIKSDKIKLAEINKIAVDYLSDEESESSYTCMIRICKILGLIPEI